MLALNSDSLRTGFVASLRAALASIRALNESLVIQEDIRRLCGMLAAIESGGA